MLLRWNSALSHTHRRRACTQQYDISQERGHLALDCPQEDETPSLRGNQLRCERTPVDYAYRSTRL